MSHIKAGKLDTGDVFPELELRLTDGGVLKVSNESDAKWLVLLFYRGHW